MSQTITTDKIKFVDYYQTPLNAGTYDISATLTAPPALESAGLSTSTTVKLHVGGPRYFLPPSEVHSVFPPENGAGDYNNVLPHVVLNRRTLPWERLVDKQNDNNAVELEKIPFLALLIFSEDEEASGDVTPPAVVSLKELLHWNEDRVAWDEISEPGDKPTDKISVIDVRQELLEHVIPTGDELRLLAHGRERTRTSEGNDEVKNHQRAVVMANRLPASPSLLGTVPDKSKSWNSGVPLAGVRPGSPAAAAGIKATDIVVGIGTREVRNIYDMTHALSEQESGDVAVRFERGDTAHDVTVTLANKTRRNIAHLVMLENRYKQVDGSLQWTFKLPSDPEESVRLVCLKSWQFTCSADEPSLRGRLLGNAFTFEPFCVPRRENSNDAFESVRSMSYAALPYHLRWGDRAHTLYHGPIVAAQADHDPADDKLPDSADGLVRLMKDNGIFDVSLAAAWQLGRLLMLRDQSVAMEYFGWRRRDAQRHTNGAEWANDGHLRPGDNFQSKLSAMPAAVRNWCTKRLQLRGIPFEYLVPDARMLPENSLRVFRIHEAWMECLISGALAIGRAGEADQNLEAGYRSIVFPNDAHNRTGFLLRSPAVEEHPDLEVAAFGDAESKSPLAEVRLQRIGHGLLLGLYTGTISTLQFSVPPIGLHFGLKEVDGNGFSKDLKNEDGTENDTEINPIPIREFENGNLGGQVIDMGGLSRSMETTTAGRFAFQMCEGTEMVEFGIEPPN